MSLFPPIRRFASALVASLLAVGGLHAQTLAQAQARSRELAAAPSPTDISIDGRIDASIPPLLGGLKRELRSWLKAKIALLPGDPDASQLRASFLAELKNANLVSDPKDHEQHPFGKILGIGISQVPGESRLMRVVVSYDSFCPPDDSVLYFERGTDSKWRPILNFDNTDFIRPWGDRSLLYAGLSPRDAKGRFYVLVVRTRSYCPGSGSVWNRINYHVLRPGADPESPRILLSAEHEYREDEDWRISLTDSGFTMDFPASSIAVSIWRTHILKFTVIGDNVRRVEPVAVNPEGFVEEWMNSPWSSAVNWSEPGEKSILQRWHEQLHRNDGGRPDVFGDLPFRQLCSSDQPLIQISFPKGFPTVGPEKGDVYFALREVGPHLFRMVNIGTDSAAGCSMPIPDETEGEHLLPVSMNRRTERLVQ